MMLIPIVVCAVALGWLVGHKPKPDIHVGSSPQHFSKVSTDSPLELFTRVIRSGQNPSAWLVSEAVRDAYEKGQLEIATSIAVSFQSLPSLPELISEPVSEPLESEACDAQVDSSSPAHEELSPPSSTPEVRSFQMQPPINGIDGEAWEEFVTAMKDRDSSFSDDQHVGMFYHNRKRLAQLGIKPESLSSEEMQYKAFETDVMDRFRSNKQLISEVVAQPVLIDGEEHSVSMSGVLALLKAAGPNNAKHWLENPDLREKFPHTKQLFLKANNLF